MFNIFIGNMEGRDCFENLDIVARMTVKRIPEKCGMKV
jgi:hypothetical protein